MCHQVDKTNLVEYFLKQVADEIAAAEKVQAQMENNEDVGAESNEKLVKKRSFMDTQVQEVIEGHCTVSAAAGYEDMKSAEEAVANMIAAELKAWIQEMKER